MLKNFMRVFFRLLYHPFAIAYDLVAATVSFGNWKNWVYSILPFINGTRILELGHGPGHLQRLLLDRGNAPVAMDESQQMGMLAKRRLGTSHKLARGIAQHLPFASESFDCIVSTFPTEYIFDSQTLAEAKRVLRIGGRLVVLPVAFPSNRFLKWLYKFTGESPEKFNDEIKSRLMEPFIKAGFKVQTHLVEVKSNTLVFIECEATQ